MKRIAVIALLTALLLTSVLASVALAKVTKFTFNDVTFSDGTTGEIEAGSKIVQSGVLTSCSYYSDDYRDYLGYYQDNTFASTDADEVRAFCLDHFADRDVS